MQTLSIGLFIFDFRFLFSLEWFPIVVHLLVHFLNCQVLVFLPLFFTFFMAWLYPVFSHLSIQIITIFVLLLWISANLLVSSLFDNFSFSWIITIMIVSMLQLNLILMKLFEVSWQSLHGFISSIKVISLFLNECHIDLLKCIIKLSYKYQISKILCASFI